MIIIIVQGGVVLSDIELREKRATAKREKEQEKSRERREK